MYGDIFHYMNELKGLKGFFCSANKIYNTIFYYKRSDHIFTFCFLKVDSKKAALWRTNLKHSVFTVKAMVAWHMRIFCCKTFFGQNSHINMQ